MEIKNPDPKPPMEEVEITTLETNDYLLIKAIHRLADEIQKMRLK